MTKEVLIKGSGRKVAVEEKDIIRSIIGRQNIIIPNVAKARRIPIPIQINMQTRQLRLLTIRSHHLFLERLNTLLPIPTIAIWDPWMDPGKRVGDHQCPAGHQDVVDRHLTIYSLLADLGLCQSLIVWATLVGMDD